MPVGQVPGPTWTRIGKRRMSGIQLRFQGVDLPRAGIANEAEIFFFRRVALRTLQLLP